MNPAKRTLRQHQHLGEPSGIDEASRRREQAAEYRERDKRAGMSDHCVEPPGAVHVNSVAGRVRVAS